MLQLTSQQMLGLDSCGRHLIHSIEGELSDTQMDELKDFRDQAVQAWESSVLLMLYTTSMILCKT